MLSPAANITTNVTRWRGFSTTIANRGGTKHTSNASTASDAASSAGPRPASAPSITAGRYSMLTSPVLSRG